ncbi:hypothetical protein J5Y04_31265 [Kitasatospora sp. RG8]|uniref:hypothetical protein n=1 Tax=Kitasatospora sp. RG8 TaxID=2820815 RepID=UPI001AE081DF|nr:hypothetical protein [Kitasatospora sp. RG8]MBP0453988.1 hypothetical protein [Kitasatospora sp. RG8]
MDSIYTRPAFAADTAVDLNAYLLQDGFVPASLDGQVVAVPLQPSPTTPALIPALVDGKVIAVPVHNPLTAAAQPQPAPAPAAQAQPAAEQGLPLALRQGILYGCVGALAVGGLTWMVGAGVGEVAPYADQIGKVLMWAAATVAAVVIGVAALLGKLRSVTSSSAGASATAGGDGSTATGTVLAMFHRHTAVTVGRQSAGWKGTVNNNVR